MDIMTLKELRESYGDLVESAIREAIEPLQKKIDETEAALKEANTKLADFDLKEKTTAQAAVVETVLKEAKIPEAAKDRVREHFGATYIDGAEAVLKEAVASKIAAELDYMKKLNPKGAINFNQDQEGDKTLQESIQADLDGRAKVGSKDTKDVKPE